MRSIDQINLNWIVDKLPGKPGIRTFILCEEEILQPAETEFVRIFTEIWNRKVFNVVIVYWNGTLSAVSFTPFPKLSLVFIPPNDLDNIDSLFWDKAQNLYGYPFSVTGFYDVSRALFDRKKPSNVKSFDGLDGLLNRLIIERMNATSELKVPADGMEIGELFPNDTATGCLGDLISGNFDMGLNVRFYRLNHFEGRVEATHTNGRDDICFLVPRKGKFIDIASIFRPFHTWTWLLIFSCLPLYVSFFYLVVMKQKNTRSFRYHFFQFFAFMLQQSADFYPKSKKQKFFIGIWMLSILLITFMYQGKLSSNQIPKDRPNIESIEQLAQSDLQIFGFSRYNRQIQEFFSDSKYNGVYEPLFKRLQNITVQNFFGAVFKLDPTHGFANKYHINSYLRRVCTQNSMIFYHHVKQCAVPFLGVYGIRYGSPYKKRINFIIRIAQESGLISKWEQNNAVQEQFSQATLQSGQDTIVPFSITHLQTTFYIWILGCVIATITFLVETFYARLQRSKRDFYRRQI